MRILRNAGKTADSVCRDKEPEVRLAGDLLGVVGVTSVAVKRIHSGVSTVLAGKSENSTNDAAALKKMQESGVFPSGTYLVGEEIPAGEYILLSEYMASEV